MGAFQQLRDAASGEDFAMVEMASERQQLEAEGILVKIGDFQPQGRVPPISDQAVDLIVMFEVSSRAAYERRYRHPIWPKGRSGITVGIGYDVGYVRPAVLAADWKGQLPEEHIDTLKVACGVTGDAAQALLPRTGAVDIPFENAMAVFRGATLVQTAALTAAALPNAERLHPDSFGALVSLVYNRGASFRLEGERYAEMRQIRGDMAALQFAQVPGRIRGMQRLWAGKPDMAGLVKRREMEAALFEEGLGA
jgi:GH24 family phage-related lysozyme (muramidase)